MGIENLNSITYNGAGANFNLGQNNNADAPSARKILSIHSLNPDRLATLDDILKSLGRQSANSTGTN